MFAKITSGFSKAVRKERDNLLISSGKESDFNAALVRIRDQYDKKFGGTLEVEI